MQPETIRQGLKPIEPCDRPSPLHFEMVYQARIASDRIRFAIKHLEQFAQGLEHVREVTYSCWTLSVGLTSWTGSFRPRLEFALDREARLRRKAGHERLQSCGD